MDNLTYFEINGVEMITVKEADDLYRTMTKAFYDEQQAQAEQSTPIVKDEPAAKK
jgi:hypothetical protein